MNTSKIEPAMRSHIKKWTKKEEKESRCLRVAVRVATNFYIKHRYIL